MAEKPKNTTTDTRWYSSAKQATTEFVISTANQLAGLAAIVNGSWGGERDDFAGKSVKLAANIDLSAYANWIPIGNHAIDEANVFAGTFDGCGHVISKLTINRPEKHRQGLFGRISGGKVRNLGVDGVNIKGYTSVGGIVGGADSYSSVSNCYSAGTVSGIRCVGGIAGGVSDNSGIANCYSAAAVSGIDKAGGIAGRVCDNSRVVDCAALNPAVSTSGDKAGRVVGEIEDVRDDALENNVAASMMINKAGNTAWKNKSAEAADGRDISTATVKKDITVGGRFAESNGWMAGSGTLPKFKAVADTHIPEKNFPGSTPEQAMRLEDKYAKLLEKLLPVTDLYSDSGVPVRYIINRPARQEPEQDVQQ